MPNFLLRRGSQLQRQRGSAISLGPTQTFQPDDFIKGALAHWQIVDSISTVDATALKQLWRQTMTEFQYRFEQLP
jgi:hypothetical protein